jgi:hypothetical protein
MPRIPLLLALLAAGCAAPREAPPPVVPPSEIGPAAPSIASVEPSKDYPINFCVVSQEDLMAMGRPVAITYNGIEVQFCCEHCIAKFKANPAKYLPVLEEAKAAKAAK